MYGFTVSFNKSFNGCGLFLYFFLLPPVAAGVTGGPWANSNSGCGERGGHSSPWRTLLCSSSAPGAATANNNHKYVIKVEKKRSFCKCFFYLLAGRDVTPTPAAATEEGIHLPFRRSEERLRRWLHHWETCHKVLRRQLHIHIINNI